MRLRELLPETRNSIAFYTSGSFQMAMHANRTLEGVTHLIIDEIHERNPEVDIILGLLKNISKVRPDLKIILMSATMDTSILMDYFNISYEALVQIPGHSYPIDIFSGKELDDALGLQNFAINFAQKLHNGIAKNRFSDYEGVAEVVRAIDRNKAPGSILVFLPRWIDIKVTRC